MIVSGRVGAAPPWQGGEMPDPGCLVEGINVMGTLMVFGLFRLFDMGKPWPIRQTHSFPCGWGGG